VITGAALALSAVLQLGAAGVREQADAEGEEAAREAEQKQVTVILEWVLNTNHTGVIVASEKGWYAEEGLQVEVKRPSESQPPLLVASGKAEFGFAPQEMVTFARTSQNPVPVVSIAAVNQHNTSGFAAPADRNIDEVADFEGKTYGGWGSEFEEALLQAVMEKRGADFSSVEIVNVGTTEFIASFRQGIDFRWIFYGWDGVRAEVEGMEINYIPLIEIDKQLDYYTPTLIIRRAMLDEEPETVRAFLRATARGYRFAAENPDKAADLLLKHADNLNPRFVHESQRYISEQYIADAERWGVMKEKLWRNFSGFLEEYDLLNKPLDVDAAFTNEFLPEER
jgi:ABC-type nitrate/sulfonate/bicarbonate transport system substrate-binding protein